MKKPDITASLLIIITCVLLVIFLSLRSIDWYVGGGGTAPSYHFLAGQNPIKCEKARAGNEDRRYVYSFKADFNDLCSKAHAELTPAGFAVRSSVQMFSGKEFRYHFYCLKEKFPRGLVHIYIYDGQQYIDLHEVYNNIPKSNCAGAVKDGWVMVEIIYGRGWQWPF